MNKKDEIYKKVKKVLIKISIVIGISILILLFLAVPIIIFFLLKNGVEKGAEDSWAIGLGFYGALLGGLGTIIAFLVTSYQTNKIQKENVKLLNEQFSQDKRLTIKPYLDLSWEEADISGIISINNNYPIPLIKNLATFECIQKLVEIRNLGLGPAIGVKISKMALNNIEITLDERVKFLNSINVNSKKNFGIDMAILEFDCNNKEIYGSKDELKKKYNISNELYFKIEYEDILENKYTKEIYLSILVKSVIGKCNYDTEDKVLYKIKKISYLSKADENSCCEELIKRSI